MNSVHRPIWKRAMWSASPQTFYIMAMVWDGWGEVRYVIDGLIVDRRLQTCHMTGSVSARRLSIRLHVGTERRLWRFCYFLTSSKTTLCYSLPLTILTKSDTETWGRYLACHVSCDMIDSSVRSHSIDHTPDLSSSIPYHGHNIECLRWCQSHRTLSYWAMNELNIQ